MFVMVVKEKRNTPLPHLIHFPLGTAVIPRKNEHQRLGKILWGK